MEISGFSLEIINFFALKMPKMDKSAKIVNGRSYGAIPGSA